MPELVREVPEVALAVYAHPDDADVACAGTLALWAGKGCAVHLLICTDGGKGTTDAAVKPADLAERRAGEIEAAASVVGLASFRGLQETDGEVSDDAPLREELVRSIRHIKPEVVIGHDPTAVFFGQDYFNHRDHRMAGWALLDAVAPAASLPHYFPAAGAPHQVSTVLLSGTLAPDVWVDVTSTVNAKAAAIECHQSQFAGRESWAAQTVRQRAREEGRRAGVRYAEGFRRLRLAS